MLGAPNTEVILGEAPAMRREGGAAFLDVRRTGGESVFVAVHEPHVGRPRIRSVRALPTRQSSDLATAVAIDLGDRTDYVLSTLDDGGRVDTREVRLEGRFGYCSMRAGGVRRIYLVDGKLLKAGDRTHQGRPAFTGEVSAIRREAAGDASNAFVAVGPSPAGLPLNGSTLIIEDSEGSTLAFGIVRAETQANTTVIHIDGEPGMELRRGHVKQLFFPNWGIAGGLRFRIPQSAVWP